MSTTSAERAPRSSRPGRLTALVLTGVLVAGCGLVTDDEEPPEPGAAPTTPVAGVPGRAKADREPVPADLAAAFGRTLDARAAAVLQRDGDAFVEGLAQQEAGFVTAQRGYYDNLAQLPVADFSYEVDQTSVVRDGDGYWAVVEVALRLDGYDAEPVRTLDRFRFERAEGGAEAGYVVASVTDPAWEEANDVTGQPWDVVPIQVRTGDGVLGVFDEGSIGAAQPLIASVERALDDVGAVVPYEWPGTVVVYGLSDTAFIETLDDLPGGTPRDVDGVAFSVPAGAGSESTAAVRVAFHPDVLDRAGPARDRLVRHELTHVAVGTHDDRAPVWLAEGIAEHVSALPMAPRRRTVAREALEAAERGGVTLAPDDSFNDADSAEHYGIAWWAVEYLVTTFGDTAVWALLDALDERGADPVERTRGLVGLGPDQLARRGARLMLAAYGVTAPDRPTDRPTDRPSDTPTRPPGDGAGGG